MTTLPVTDTDLVEAVRDKRVLGKLFAHRGAPDGLPVAVRLNLNCRVRKDNKVYSIQTIHSKQSPHSRALGYDTSVTIRSAIFMVDQAARAAIASGRIQKMPMAAVLGHLSHSLPNLEGIEIRFNPKTSHLFTRADDGRAVKSADEVTVFHTRAYARGEVIYWDAESAPQPLEGIASDARY